MVSFPIRVEFVRHSPRWWGTAFSIPTLPYDTPCGVPTNGPQVSRRLSLGCKRGLRTKDFGSTKLLVDVVGGTEEQAISGFSPFLKSYVISLHVIEMFLFLYCF